jgi:uncharacterized damage-inducible protein DinB
MDSVIRLLQENVRPRPGRKGWHGGPTPGSAVRGLSARQALWRPGAGRHNVWELVLHIAYWKYAVRRRLEGGRGERFPRSPANWPRVPARADEAQWAADVALLREEDARLRDAIGRVSRAGLGRALRPARRWTVGETIVGIAQHDAYHTGQIQLLKRLQGVR